MRHVRREGVRRLSGVCQKFVTPMSFYGLPLVQTGKLSHHGLLQ